MTRHEQAFVWLSALTIGVIMLVIMLGTLVRITEADLACGGHYPLCNGRLFPRMDNHLGWIDWGHRLSTAISGALILLTIWKARRFPALRRRVYVIASLILLQSIVGAGTMLLDEPDTLPALHLGLAVIMLSCLVSAVVSIRYRPAAQITVEDDSFPGAVHGATLLTFLVLMTGAMIVGGSVEHHCDGFPLCGGSMQEGDVIHLVHRGSVLMLGLLFATLFWRARTERRPDASANYGTSALLALYFTQVALGAWIAVAGNSTAIQTLHVLMAVLMWSTAAALSTAIGQQRNQPLVYPSIAMETEWQEPSSATTSS